MPSFRPAIKARRDAACSRRRPRSCAMLRATVKLCCGIAHDHLRRPPGKHRSPPPPTSGKTGRKEGPKGDAKSASDGHLPWKHHVYVSVFLPRPIMHTVVLVLAANELPAETRDATASSSHAPCSPKRARLSPRFEDNGRCGNREGCERAGGKRIPSPAFQNSSLCSEADGEGDR